MPDAQKILRRNAYGWFVRIERGVYGLTDGGRTALNRWNAHLKDYGQQSSTASGDPQSGDLAAMLYVLNPGVGSNKPLSNNARLSKNGSAWTECEIQAPIRDRDCGAGFVGTLET